MTLNCQICFESFCQAQAQTKAARPAGWRTVSSALTKPVMSWVAPTIHSSPGLVSNSSTKVIGCLLVTTGCVWLYIAMADTHVLHLRKEHPLKQQKIRICPCYTATRLHPQVKTWLGFKVPYLGWPFLGWQTNHFHVILSCDLILSWVLKLKGTRSYLFQWASASSIKFDRILANLRNCPL